MQKPFVIKSDSKNISDLPLLEDRKLLWIGLLGITCLAFFLFRSFTFSVPLDRDEGEYAYGAHCLLQGLLPYESFYSLKWPGIFACYALIFSVFGESGEAIRVGLAVLQGLNALLLFWLGRSWFSGRVGFFSALFFLLLSFSPCFDGFHANAEAFVLFPALLGILILRRALFQKKGASFVLAGIFFGIALLIKQHAFGFVIFGFLFGIFSRNGSGTDGRVSFLAFLFPFVFGMGLPFFLTLLLYWDRGTLESFWFWTVTYARCYVSLLDWGQGWMILKERLAEITIQAGWCLGFIVLSGASKLQNRPPLGWIWILLLCTALTLFPGFYFRRHYFLMCLPALAILAAIGCETLFLSLEGKIVGVRKGIGGALLTALLGWAAFQGTGLRQGAEGHAYWQSFQSVAGFLKERSKPGDSAAYLGSEPQVFFYSGLSNATPFLYAYPLLEPQPWALSMQDEMIQAVEGEKPRFLLFHFSQPALGVTEFSEKKIFYWFQEFKKQYREILRVEFDPVSGIFFREGESLASTRPPDTDWLAVYERIPS